RACPPDRGQGGAKAATPRPQPAVRGLPGRKRPSLTTRPPVPQDRRVFFGVLRNETQKHRGTKKRRQEDRTRRKEGSTSSPYGRLTRLLFVLLSSFLLVFSSLCLCVSVVQFRRTTMPGLAVLMREIHRLRRFAHDLQEQIDRVPR